MEHMVAFRLRSPKLMDGSLMKDLNVLSSDPRTADTQHIKT